VALFKALTDGARDFTAIAIAARLDGGAMPCGACRQLLAEFAPDAMVMVVDSRRPTRLREFTVAQLLPGAFLRFAPKRADAPGSCYSKRGDQPIKQMIA
jgi:cytidine deaminase